MTKYICGVLLALTLIGCQGIQNQMDYATARQRAMTPRKQFHTFKIYFRNGQTVVLTQRLRDLRMWGDQLVANDGETVARNVKYFSIISIK